MKNLRPVGDSANEPSPLLQESEGELSDELGPQSPRPQVILVSRELRMRALGATSLQMAGFEVEVVSLGSELLERCGEALPDVILSDAVLEDEAAGGLRDRVRELSGAETVPFLILTDLQDPSILEESLRDDFTDVVGLPVHWKLLAFRLRRWVATSRRYRELTARDLDLEQVRDSAVEASTELLKLRHFDSVTGLPNREMFLSTMELTLSQIERNQGYAAVLFLDLDDFSEINALIGRPLADETLRMVAARLRETLRDELRASHADVEGVVTSLARLASDQFAVLVGSVRRREEVAAVAARLLEKLARPFRVLDRDFRLSARVGIADTSDLERGGPDLLLERAETAMRFCKQRKGRPYAFFESSMGALVMEKVELKAQLRRALDEDELFLCYQLLVDSETTVPTGVEALVRWQHPERGTVLPDDFLKVAEESELIVEVDRWVLREGCRQGALWRQRGLPPLTMSLNVSRRFLEEDTFAEEVLAIVEETGFPPGSLQLEISERGTLPDAGRVMSQFEVLVLRGIQLAIDDFGTGQTSLSYLRTLPVGCVKVDRSFVGRAPVDPASAAIVAAIAAMSHHLGLRVVGEGVETEDQWRLLARHGYDQQQGFLFSHPEPAREIEELLVQGSEGEVTVESGWPARLSGEVLARVEEPASEGQGSSAEGEGGGSASRAGRSPGAKPVGVFRRDLLPPGSAGDPLAVPRGAGPLEDRSESDAFLVQLARRDYLTRLYNRYSLEEQLERAKARAERQGHRMALLLLDLDDFKYVNDTHGHAVGDGLLVALADRLRDAVSPSDTLARIGGDEFAVVLSEIQDVGDVAEFGSRLLMALAEPAYVEGRELAVTGSMGISIHPADGDASGDLLRRADLALYEAKRLGGHRIRFFSQTMDEERRRGRLLSRDLSLAVERGQLHLEYQPRVALADGALLGVEALLRWTHPEEGAVDPERFVPLAEHSGEMRAIGRWVIGEACAQLGRWREELGRELAISVNLSSLQCRDPEFAESVIESLREHALDPGLLDLEVDEGLLERLPGDRAFALHRLAELGVGLTLDNFGTGASAIEKLQRFPFDRLKIDRSLVRSILRSSTTASVLRGIVALAREMGVQVVAQGIELPGELRSLQAEGCHAGQGFLVSRPLSAEELPEWLRRWESDEGRAPLFARAAS